MQTLALLVLLAGGAVVCVLATRTITLRWQFPWREALMYFGLAPYPHEVAPPRRERR